jgi:hypothetical protein
VRALHRRSIELGGIATASHGEEAEHGAAGAERNPGKTHCAEHQENALQHGELHDGQHLVQQACEDGGGDDRQDQQHGPRPRQAITPLARSGW